MDANETAAAQIAEAAGWAIGMIETACGKAAVPLREPPVCMPAPRCARCEGLARRNGALVRALADLNDALLAAIGAVDKALNWEEGK
jgi:hypothetical protein